MAKNRKTPDMNLPMWFDGQNINEALFCEEFLQERIKQLIKIFILLFGKLQILFKLIGKLNVVFHTSRAALSASILE